MGQTGIINDPIFLLHQTGEHVEIPERLIEINRVLDALGLKKELKLLTPKKATKEQLKLFHSSEHINKIERIGKEGGGQLDSDTVMSSKSFETALWAVGGAVSAVEAVMEGVVKNSFAFVRPPGHHAEADKAMGFCLFNNGVIAVKEAKDKYGLKRILMLDWDAHHGNGIQNAFYDDPSVLYISLHQDGIFPQTGWANEVGEGLGEGFNINTPVSRWTGDAGFYYLFTKLILPVAYKYKPELIIINAGFDAHFADDMSGLEVTTAGFKWMTDMVLEVAEKVCQGRLVALLEGGYHLETIGYSVAAMLASMTKSKLDIKDPLPTPRNIIRPQTRIRIDDALQIQQRYWG